MKKFELMRGSAEIEWRDRECIKTGCVFDRDSDPELVKSFDSKEDAISALNKCESSISQWIRANGFSFCEVEEYWIEANNYDEDGDLYGWSDILDCTEMPELPED